MRLIMKKIIICFTIVSLLNLFGCHYQKQMNPGEFDFEDNWDMQVTAKDTLYDLNRETISIQMILYLQPYQNP